MKAFTRLLCCGCLLVAPVVAQAAFINFTATLTTDAEFPAPGVPSTATGSLVAILDTDTNVFMWILTAKDLTAPTTAVHFHGNTPTPPNHQGLTRPPILGFIGAGVDPDVTPVFDTLTNATAGTFIGSADLDLALNDLGGDAPLTVEEQIAGLLNTQWYVNIHNANNPAGEIRGQVFLASPTAIPLPPVAWLLGAAFGAVALRAQRRRAA